MSKDAACIDYFNMGQWPIYVGFTTSRKAFAREMKRLSCGKVDFLSTTHANATTHTLTKDGTLTFIIAMEKQGERSVEQVAGLVAHEATHVAQRLWEQIGESRPGDEAEAYLVQMITQSCLEIALKTGRTKKAEP